MVEEKVSVILPTYNRASLLGRAIQSVLKQTYKNFELIIIDDGSTDDTGSVIRSVQDERLICLRHQIQRGSAEARNSGIRAATGELIAFQDSDDEWLPEKLAKQIETMGSAPDEVGVVYTGLLRVKGGTKEYIPSSEIKQREGYILEALIHRNFITTPAILVRRDCFDVCGLFDSRLPRLQDWELALRLAKNFKFKLVDEPLLLSYQTENNISANRLAFGQALEQIIEKHFDLFQENRKVLAGLYYRLGSVLYLEGEPDKGRYYLQQAMSLDAFNLKHRFAWYIARLSKTLYHRIAQINPL